MKENIIKDKSFQFGNLNRKAHKYLTNERKEFILSKQLLRSGTSIGANVREAINGASKADFIHKLRISLKEADETAYWMELLKETDYLNEEQFSSIYSDCTEIIKILKSIILTCTTPK